MSDRILLLMDDRKKSAHWLDRGVSAGFNPYLVRRLRSAVCSDNKRTHQTTRFFTSSPRWRQTNEFLRFKMSKFSLQHPQGPVKPSLAMARHAFWDFSL